MSAQSGSKDKEVSARSKTARSNSVDTLLSAKSNRTLEIQSPQKHVGKLTSDADEQPSESNDGSSDESTDQSRSLMKVNLPTFKGDVKEHTRHYSPETVGREYRVEERHETRVMDTKGRIEFKTCSMVSEYQTKIRDDSSAT